MLQLIYSIPRGLQISFLQACENNYEQFLFVLFQFDLENERYGVGESPLRVEETEYDEARCIRFIVNLKILNFGISQKEVSCLQLDISVLMGIHTPFLQLSENYS